MIEQYIVVTTGGNDTAYLVVMANGYVNWMPFVYTDEVKDFAEGKLKYCMKAEVNQLQENLFRQQPDNKERFDGAEWFKL